jgi:hypothetical protein
VNEWGALFLAVATVLVALLPRRLALLPVLAAAAWMTRGQVVEVASANFTILRLVVGVGVLRVLLRGETVAGGWKKLDTLMLVWAVLLLTTSAFHSSEAWLLRAGIVWTELGSYVLFRVFVRDFDDVVRAFSYVCVGLAPIAVSMLFEKLGGSNPFAAFGGVGELSAVREGNIRASGPFAHAILAGTVGVTCLSMAAAIWSHQRLCAVAGLLSGATMLHASTSSGPVLMFVFVVIAMLIWHMRQHLRVLLALTVAAVLALAAMMNDPVYFIMARIDISGGSSGYYRSQLIRSSIEHFEEWWLAGTDYTRHWMATGITANPNHADLVNHFVLLGVAGGLPLLVVFVAVLHTAFRDVGRASASATRSEGFFIWSLGAILFGFTMNFLSSSPFDNSVVFLYLLLASIGAVAVQPIAMRTHTQLAVAGETQ